MVRLFVGLSLPEPMRAAVLPLMAGLPGARWMAPESLHVTVRFIGEVEEGLARELHDALVGVAAPGFALTLSGVGSFGTGARSHTLWAGVERVPGLVRLRDKVESTLVRAGLTPEGRKYTPHVTLARLRRAAAPRLPDFLASYNLFRAGPVDVTRFVLFSSHLGRGGAAYRVEAEYPLVVG